MCKKLSANEKAKINQEYEKSITLYTCVDTFTLMYKSMIDNKVYKNPKANIASLQKRIEELEEYRLYVEANISKSDLEQLEIFRVENKVLMKRLNISDKKVIKMKKDIRDKFIEVYNAYKELIQSLL